MEQIKQGNHSLPPNLLTILRKLEKTFTEESDPVFLDENGKKLTMKEIHSKECVGDKPITMIAVSRHQYDVANFPKYINYIKNTLKKNTIYYGLYPDVKRKKVEYDVKKSARRKLGSQFYFFITTNHRQKFLDHEELPISALVEK
jgi:hypothetical protein